MENEGPGFAVIDEDGVAFHVAKTYDEALAAASEAIPDADIWYEGPPPWEANEPEPMTMAANMGEVIPLRSKKNRFETEPARAMGLIGLSPMTNDQIGRVSLEAAHRTLQPFFPTTRTDKHGKIKDAGAYKTAAKMSRAFLSENHKLTKPPREGLPLSRTIGLNLMPAKNWRRPDVQKVVQVLGSKYGVKTVKLPPGERTTVCASATAQCSASCLVFSGQHGNDRYNVVKKISLTMALFHEPVAFMRVLYDAIEAWARECECMGAAPFVRLNMLSDIPWELLVPEMFDRFRDVHFYDYTKVAGRMPMRGGAYPIPNYDLTFSYSGSGPNLEALNYEIEQNKRRIAVTFATIGKSRHILKMSRLLPRKPPAPGGKESAPTWPQSAAAAQERGVSWVGLPEEFMGLPVIDGDQSDFRPYDPPKCIVGLRWKIPSGQDVTASRARLFIVPGYLVREEGEAKPTRFVIMELPRYTKIFRGEARPWEDLDFSDETEIEEAD